MFPADSPLAALSVTRGTLRGQAVLALAGAARMERGQGPGGCGWAPGCTHVLGKSTVLGVLLSACCPHVSVFTTFQPSVSLKELQSGGTQMSLAMQPQGSAAGKVRTQKRLSAGGTWHMRCEKHRSSPGRWRGKGDQAKGTVCAMLRVLGRASAVPASQGRKCSLPDG